MLTSVFWPRRIRHSARYFGVLAILCLAAYKYSAYSYQLLIFLGPPYFIVYWLRVHVPFLIGWLPNEAVYNDGLVYFLTFIYFCLVGFQFKSIYNERGFLRLVFFLAFVAFLFYIHSASFQELSLYWEGSPTPAAVGLP